MAVDLADFGPLSPDLVSLVVDGFDVVALWCLKGRLCLDPTTNHGRNDGIDNAPRVRVVADEVTAPRSKSVGSEWTKQFLVGWVVLWDAVAADSRWLGPLVGTHELSSLQPTDASERIDGRNNGIDQSCDHRRCLDSLPREKPPDPLSRTT